MAENLVALSLKVMGSTSWSEYEKLFPNASNPILAGQTFEKPEYPISQKLGK